MQQNIWQIPKGSRKFWSDILANSLFTIIAITALTTQSNLPDAFYVSLGIAFGITNGTSRLANMREHQNKE